MWERGGGPTQGTMREKYAALKRSNVTATLSDVSNGPRCSREEKETGGTPIVFPALIARPICQGALPSSEQRLCERTDIGPDARVNRMVNSIGVNIHTERERDNCIGI